MEIKILLLLLTVGFSLGQSDFSYRPVARGHYIYNGQYQNQPPQQQNQPQPQTSNNVIGNTAVNTYGNGAVNSIVGSNLQSESSVNSIVNPTSGSSNNVIGNRAYNVHGGAVNSVAANPFYNLPGLSSAFDTPLGAQYANAALQEAFG